MGIKADMKLKLLLILIVMGFPQTVLAKDGMPEAAPLIKLPSNWTAFFSSLSRKENGAWVVLGVGVFFLGIAIKGLLTGSIWETVNRCGFDSGLWLPDDSYHYDRNKDSFNFWLTLIFVSSIGVICIYMSLKMFGIW
jgi:hypothetical protein